MACTVSVITPCYNSESVIKETIESVLEQTYQDWEMLIIDDCSTDRSAEIILAYCKIHPRIKYMKTEFASGSPALPRNLGIKYANGRYIAFLDSDDLWLPQKLEEQLSLFENENVAIVYSDYEKMDMMGKRAGRVIKALAQTSYRELLKENVIACLTAVYDVNKVGKVYFSRVGHEDFVVWLSILKKGFRALNTNTVTALYREQNKSLSANKWKAISWTWNIYRNVENLTFLRSCYYFMHYAVRAGFKYFK